MDLCYLLKNRYGASYANLYFDHLVAMLFNRSLNLKDIEYFEWAVNYMHGYTACSEVKEKNTWLYLMLHINFNSEASCTYLQRFVRHVINTSDDLPSKLATINSLIYFVQKTSACSGEACVARRQSLKDHLLLLLQVEQDFYTNRLNPGPGALENIAGAVLPYGKIATSLSVEELAALTRALKEKGIFTEQNITLLIKQVISCFQTVRTEEIAFPSFWQKYHNVEGKTAINLKNKVIDLHKKIHEF